MNIDSKKLVYRKLSSNEMDLFIRLRLDFINEIHKDIDEAEKDKIKNLTKRLF